MSKKATYSTPSPLKVLRQSHQLSLRELGAEAKIDFRRLSIIERGLSDDEVRRLAKAVKALSGHNVSAGVLLRG